MSSGPMISNEKPIFRRIIAEDLKFNLNIVPSLAVLCQKKIINVFEYNSNLLKGIKDVKQRNFILSKLALDIPLKVAFDCIDFEPYWKRRCLSNWEMFNIHIHGDSWKRAFAEKYVQDLIENTNPGNNNDGRLLEVTKLLAPYIISLRIEQLLPPIVKKSRLNNIDPYLEGSGLYDDVEEDELDKDDLSDLDEPSKYDHLDLSEIMAELKHLKLIDIAYTVKDCGMNFEWNIFQFTGQDCLSISRAIQTHQNLTTIRLTRSRIDCDRCRILAGHLLNHPTVTTLDLSHNCIEDRGARAIGQLLNGHSNISDLNVSNNAIRIAGSHAIGYPIFKNSTQLERLNLRLNRLQDEGVINIAKALMKSKSIREINLSANDFGVSGATYISQVIAANTDLVSLDISNNKIGYDGSQRLQEAMETNTNLQHLDIRLCGCNQEAEHHISERILENQKLIFHPMTSKPRTSYTFLPELKVA